jgi:hypothetical protein
MEFPRLALAVCVVAIIKAGCAGTQPAATGTAQQQPEPASCPQEALDAMREVLGWSPGMEPYIRFVYDERQPGNMAEKAILKQGPVTGLLENKVGSAPAGTRVDGRLWVNGNYLYGRYTRMHLAGGRTVPVCFEIEVVATPLIVEGQEPHESEDPQEPGEIEFPCAWHVMPIVRYSQDP